MKKAIITIAGAPGSGKSSTAKAVAVALGYKHFSSGDLFRKIAEGRGVSVEEVNLHQDVDHTVDALLQEMYQTQENIVIDSRLAWHWMPDSFKVFLSLDIDTSAGRIFSNIQKQGRVSESASSVAEIKTSVERRFAIEQKKYAELYNVDPTDPTNYDLAVDTKQNDLQAVISVVLEEYKAWRDM